MAVGGRRARWRETASPDYTPAMVTPRRGAPGSGRKAGSSAATPPKQVEPEAARVKRGVAKTRSAKPRTAKSPRTAGGKHANPARLAAAQAESQEGLRERTEAGHRAAGRTPPSQLTTKRSSGAVRKV